MKRMSSSYKTLILGEKKTEEKKNINETLSTTAQKMIAWFQWSRSRDLKIKDKKRRINITCTECQWRQLVLWSKQCVTSTNFRLRLSTLLIYIQ